MSAPVAANSLGQMFWFGVLSLIYTYMDYKLQVSQTPSPAMRSTYFSIYLLLSVIGQYFITLGLSASICGTPQFYTSIFAVFFPWTFIFGVMALMLQVFPAWLAPFSNTLGYFVVSMSGLSKIMREILLDPISGGELGDAASKALSHIYADQSVLINQVTLTNFDTFWNDISTLRKGGDQELLKTKLRHLVILKNTISRFIWYTLAGVLAISVSYNYLVNANCSTTVQHIEQKQMQSAKATKTAEMDAANQVTYTISE